MSFTPCEYSVLIQGLGVSLFIFSLANHAVGVLTVTTHPVFNHGKFCLGALNKQEICDVLRKATRSHIISDSLS